jgi:pimeloyl-ACP methyl ester carboxylesterase
MEGYNSQAEKATHPIVSDVDYFNNAVYFEGNYTVYAVVDSASQVTESNENNNGTNYKTVSLNMGGNITINNIGAQVSGVAFPITINTTNIPVGTKINISTGNGQLGNISSFNLDKTGQTSFMYRLDNISYNQQIYLSPVGSNGTYSNKFDVAAQPGTLPGVTTTYYGGIDLKVVDALKTGVANVNVEASCLNNDCAGSVVTKVTNSTGNVTFTGHDLASLSQQITLKFKAVSPAVEKNINVTRNVGTSVFRNVEFYRTVDSTHNPVILVPGIMGSTIGSEKKLIPLLSNTNPKYDELYIADGTGAWGYNSDPDLYVGGFMPLGWEGLRSTLESYGYVRNQTIIDCPYDWRNSVEKSALTYFARCVEEAQRLNPGKKVDVIAHSMGGLVTRAYIQQNDGGTNAQKINKIFFVGTPQEGATDAYYAWEGGDSRNTVREWVIDGTYKLVEGRDLASVVHDATLKKLKEMQVTPNEIQFVQEIKLQKQKEVKRFFEEHKVLGVKQLLPTYKFLDAVPNGTSTDVDRLSVDKNKNEFLIALNKYTDYSCGNNLCDEGAHLKPSYNFSTLQQAKTWGNLTMKMFYANKPERVLGVGPITNEAATKHIVNVTNTPYPYGLYEDGVPWTVGPDVFSKGDGTVPEVSTKIFSQNSGGAISLSAEKEGEHAALPRVFQSELAAEMAGHAMLATLQNVATVTARMNVHTLGNVSVKLAAQTGEVVGIDEGTKTGVQTFTNVENLNIGQNSSIITLSEPTANQYTLKVFGEESGPVDVYIDYVNQTTGKMNSFNFTVYHDKTRVENIKFTLNPTATTNEELIVLDGRLTRELENVKVVNTNGKTYVTLTAFTMGSSPIWYRLYSKLPNESRYQFVSQVQVQTYGNIPTNFDFAGPNEAITRQFRLSAVYSDNTESALGKVYENNDSDWDGLTDIKEINLLTNPLVEDTDKDGLTDGIEVMITGTDPTKKDTDNNGVEDYEQNKTKYNLKDRVPETLPAGIVANSYYKFDGVLGSVDKKKDQMRAEGAITEYSILSSVGRTGIADSSYTFSGGRAQLDAPVVLTNNPMTYSFWVKTTQSEFARMLSMNANGSRNFFDINIYAGKLNIELGSNQNIGFAGTKVVNDNVWHKVDVTIRNNPNVEIKTYVDGVYDVGVGGSGHFLASNLNGKINLGVAQNWLYPETYQSHFSGSIDDLKIYDRVLTATEIQSEYNLDIGVANTTPNVPPVLFLKGDTEMLIYKNTSWQDPGANAFDMEDGNISGLIQISGTVNTNIVGTTTLTYSVSDSKYATTTKARYVSVIDSLVNISTSTATSTSGLPVPIAEYKADGPIGSVEKTRDEKRVDKSITEVSMLTGSGIKEQANTAYQFGGSGRASFEAPKILTNTAMTYSLWVKTNQGGFARLLSMNANGSRNFLDININAGKTNFEIGSSQNLGLQGVKTINDNIWHKIDLTIENNPNATIKIYVDGLLDNSVTGTGPFTASNINNKINLGVAQNWDNATLYQSYFSGSMDEVRIYDKVLSATEIKGMYDADLDLPNTAPTLALIGSDTMSIFKGDIYTELGATASDAEEGNLTTSIVITGTVDVNTVGQYSLVYKVTDSKGLTVSKTRTVNVVSKPLPDIYSQFKFNGSLGSAGKKVDTILPTNSVTTESEVLSDADRNGEVDGSYKTVGGTSHILLTNSKIVTDQSMTYSFWVKSGQTSGTGSVFAYNSSNQTRNFFNVWLSNGRIYPELAWISDSGSYMWVQPNTAIKNVSDNKWHKVDIVIQNNPNAEIRSYIDGQLESTTNASSPYRLQSIESLVRFGVVKNWSTFALEAPFIGSVDDFRVYDKALTSAEVSAVYSDDKTSMLSSFTLDEAVSGGSLVPVEIDRTGFPEGYGVLEVRPGSSHPIGVTSNQAVQAETMSTTTEPYTRTNTD